MEGKQTHAPFTSSKRYIFKEKKLSQKQQKRLMGQNTNKAEIESNERDDFLRCVIYQTKYFKYRSNLLFLDVAVEIRCDGFQCCHDRVPHMGGSKYQCIVSLWE